MRHGNADVCNVEWPNHFSSAHIDRRGLLLNRAHAPGCKVCILPLSAYTHLDGSGRPIGCPACIKISPYVTAEAHLTMP